MKTGSRSEKTCYKYCMSPIKRTSHAVYDLKYHMVWVPKYRKMILKGDLAKRITEVFTEIAERYEFEVDTMEVKDDHVHLFLSAPPRYSPAGIVQIIKSISAKMVFKQFPDVKKQLWGGELWSDGYFVRSVGDKVTSEVIRRYIKYQQQEQLSFEF
ncbi:MAG: IS200/IS605 family transposase [Thermodesulfobacteriota bacterium]